MAINGAITLYNSNPHGGHVNKYTQPVIPIGERTHQFNMHYYMCVYVRIKIDIKDWCVGQNRIY